MVLAIDSFEETFRSKLPFYFPQYAGPSGFLHGQSECPPALTSFLADGAGCEAGDALHLLISETSRNVSAYLQPTDSRRSGQEPTKRQRRVSDYWELKGLQGLLREFNISLSVNGCSWKAKPAYVNKFVLSSDGRHMQKIQVPTGYSGKIEVHKTDGKAHYYGLHRCGNVNVCPVCNRRIAGKRGMECRQIAQYLLERDYRPLFITLTANHNDRQTFVELREKQTLAIADFFKSNEYRKFKKEFVIVHHILSNEVTADNPYYKGYKRGWHLHKHIVLFSMRDEKFDNQYELNIIQQRLTLIWRKYLNRYGLTCNDTHGVYIPQIEDRANYFNDDKDDVNRIVSYIAKGISHELTGARNKQHDYDEYKPNKLQRRISVWELQRIAIRTKDRAIKEKYIEYVNGMKGMPSVHFSRGLRDLCGIAVKSNQELVQDNEGQEVVYSFENPREWNAITRQAGQSKLLDRVTDGEDICNVIDAALQGYDIGTGEYLGISGPVPSPDARRRREMESTAC